MAEAAFSSSSYTESSSLSCECMLCSASLQALCSLQPLSSRCLWQYLHVLLWSFSWEGALRKVAPPKALQKGFVLARPCEGRLHGQVEKKTLFAGSRSPRRMWRILTTWLIFARAFCFWYVSSLAAIVWRMAILVCQLPANTFSFAYVLTFCVCEPTFVFLANHCFGCTQEWCQLHRHSATCFSWQFWEVKWAHCHPSCHQVLPIWQHHPSRATLCWHPCMCEDLWWLDPQCQASGHLPSTWMVCLARGGRAGCRLWLPWTVLGGSQHGRPKAGWKPSGCGASEVSAHDPPWWWRCLPEIWLHHCAVHQVFVVSKQCSTFSDVAGGNTKVVNKSPKPEEDTMACLWAILVWSCSMESTLSKITKPGAGTPGESWEPLEQQWSVWHGVCNQCWWWILPKWIQAAWQFPC